MLRAHTRAAQSHLSTASLPPEDLPLDLLGPLRSRLPGVADQVAAVVQTYLSDANDGVAVVVDELDHAIKSVKVCLFWMHAYGRVQSKALLVSGGVVVDARAQLNNLVVSFPCFLRLGGGRVCDGRIPPLVEHRVLFQGADTSTQQQHNNSLTKSVRHIVLQSFRSVLVGKN